MFKNVTHLNAKCGNKYAREAFAERNVNNLQIIWYCFFINNYEEAS